MKREMTSKKKLLRGGSWYFDHGTARCSARFDYLLDFRIDYYVGVRRRGFRLVVRG